MNPKNMRLVLICILGALSVLFVAIAFMGTSIISGKSRQIADLKASENTANAQLTKLLNAQREVEKYSYFNDIAKTVIPADKNQAQAITDISTFARESGFDLESVSFPTSNLGQRAAATGSKSATSGGQKTQASPVSQAKAFGGIPGLYVLPVTVTPQSGTQVPPQRQVTFPKLYNFLSKLERNRRTSQITEVSITVDDNSPAINFTMDINLFLKP